jgi:hypothetical protein
MSANYISREPTPARLVITVVVGLRPRDAPPGLLHALVLMLHPETVLASMPKVVKVTVTVDFAKPTHGL